MSFIKTKTTGWPKNFVKEHQSNVSIAYDRPSVTLLVIISLIIFVFYKIILNILIIII